MRVLILGGTSEAAKLARVCAGRADMDVISSLAGRTREPAALPGEVRIGGFGGSEGLQRFLIADAIDRVVDATHPFAARISANAEIACRRLGVARLRLLRPPWQAQRGDRWIDAADMTDAAARLPTLGRTAFVTVGHGDLEALGRLPDVRLVVRTIELPACRPLRDAVWLCGRGPFRLEDELRLLRAHGIDVLLTKASGGDATYAKLAAARDLGLPVLMVRRPQSPPGPVVESVAGALAWLETRPVKNCHA
jgi:precorrin-6A/cobalt-precorrin-6A reductase